MTNTINEILKQDSEYISKMKDKEKQSKAKVLLANIERKINHLCFRRDRVNEFVIALLIISTIAMITLAYCYGVEKGKNEKMNDDWYRLYSSVRETELNVITIKKKIEN